MDSEQWIPTAQRLPPEQVTVMTKIDDINGCRNVAPLRLGRGLWWMPDSEMFVYYAPTHWKLMQ